MRIATLAIAAALAATAAQAGDRYGASGAAARPSETTSPASPRLTWANKTAEPALRGPQGPRRLPNGLYASTTAPATRAPQAPPPQAPLPQNLYDTAAQTRPYAQAEPHFYSVYREYGGEPDPMPERDYRTTMVNRPTASVSAPPVAQDKDDDDQGPASGDEDKDTGDYKAFGADVDWGAGLMGGPQ